MLNLKSHKKIHKPTHPHTQRNSSPIKKTQNAHTHQHTHTHTYPQIYTNTHTYTYTLPKRFFIFSSKRE